MDIANIQSTGEEAQMLNEEYRKKLKLTETDYNLLDPCKTSNRKKIHDVKLWPPVNLGNIFEYILSMREFNNEYIGKYKDQKAYNYFNSNFVGQVLIYKGNVYLILFCNVRASMSIRDDKELWIVVKPTGKIFTAWCSCMAGPSRCCNHIIATLYNVGYANSNSFCSPSCTSMPCRWNQSIKKVIEPKRISEIVVPKKIRTKLGENSKTEINREENRMIELSKVDPRIIKHQNMTGDRLSNLLFSLFKSNPVADFFKSIEECAIPTKSNLTVLDTAKSIFLENGNDDEKNAKFLRCLCFSDNDVQAIEKMTRTRSISPRWKEHRKGRLTASKHHGVFTKVNTLAKSKSSYSHKVAPLVADLIYQDHNLDHIEAIKWGHDHEEDAAKAFYALEATKHLDFKVELADFLLIKLELTLVLHLIKS